MKRNVTRRGLGWLCGMAGLAVAMSGVLAPEADAQSSVNRKLKRQINVMEKVINEVLLDSPNILVFSQDPAHGIYLDEFGVVFTFDASLVEKDSKWDWDDFDWNRWRDKVRVERDGNKITIYTEDDEDEDSDQDEEADEEEEAEDPEDWEAWKSEQDAAEAKVYAQGKEELINVLLDYGDTLTGLRDGQWVVIAAFLKNADYFTEQKISRLILKASITDLRAHGMGDLTQEAMRGKVQEEEY